VPVSSKATPDAGVRSEKKTFEVFRYVPEEDDEPHTETYEVEAFEGMTVLDGLLRIRDEKDPSLTVRHSCRMARCGSDAVYINGTQRLACNTQVASLDEPIEVEPLPHEDVIRDLVVDQEDFWKRMRNVEPWFQPDSEPETGDEYLQSPENRREIDEALDCIMCGACTSSCGPVTTDGEYVGPAALVKSYRFVKDEREGKEARRRRLELLDEPHGVWRCHTQFNCTEVCPKEIKITTKIMKQSKAATKERLRFW